MSHWLQPPGRRLGLTLAITFLVGLLGGYAWAGWRHRVGTGPGRSSPLVEAGLDQEDLLPVVTRPETVLRFESFHTDCRLLFSRVEPAGRARAGYTREGLMDILAGWQIAQFGHDQVVLRRSTDEPCPDTGATFTLGIADGRIVVYRGAAAEGEIYAETGMGASDLLPGDRQLLEQGVVVHGERQIWQFLEGLNHGAPKEP